MLTRVRRRRLLVFVILMSRLMPFRTEVKTIFVDASATGADGGSNWLGACTSLQMALSTVALMLADYPLYAPDAPSELYGGVRHPDVAVEATVTEQTCTAVDNRDETWILPGAAIRPALDKERCDGEIIATGLAGNISTRGQEHHLAVYSPWEFS